jgi:hypothetical protein
MLSKVYALRSFFVFVLTVAPCLLEAQENDAALEELYNELDSLFEDETIPDDLFALVDSLLASENEKISALQMRIGYVSTIVSAGRTFGVEQFGLTPGISYFHHSGLSASATGYWSNEYSPSYYLTNLSLGYTRYVKDLTVMLNHDFYLYHDTLDDHSFDKSISFAANYQLKYADVGFDYAFLYGNETAHRLTATANARFKLKLDGFLDAITFMPGASFQWGNANVFYLRQPRTAVSDLYSIVKTNDFPRLGFREYLRLTYLLENNRTGAVNYFLTRRDYTPEEIITLMDQYYDGQINEQDTFGFMNYSISLPVIMRSGRWSLLLNYTYNVPQPLPGETFEYDPSGYFSTSLSYLFYWRKR